MKSDKYILYQKQYEDCQKKSDKLTLASDRISLLWGILFAIAGLLLFLGFQQKKPALLIPVFGLGQAQSGVRISLPFGSVCRGKNFQQILNCRFPMR